MYLLEDAVGDTLGWIAANAAPTSTILFDYTYDVMIQMAKDMANINLDGFSGTNQAGGARTYRVCNSLVDAIELFRPGEQFFR
jgi:O-methyltransferase involved in polyketide biosynthesis